MRNRIAIPTVLLLLLMGGCATFWRDYYGFWGIKIGPDTRSLRVASFSDPVKPGMSDPPVVLRRARRGRRFALQITKFPDLGLKKPALRFQPLTIKGSDARIDAFSAWQVLPMPIDANRAAYVRDTGLSVTQHRLPRALLPLPMDKNTIPLRSIRAEASPLDPASHPQVDDPVAPTVWVDLRIPITIPAGEYEGACQVLEWGKPVCNVLIKLTVDDIVISDERHLLLTGPIDWQRLTQLYPEQFKSIPPHLLSRKNAQCAAAVKVLDQLVELAQAHRVQPFVPRLQPLVKWPSGKPVQIDWAEFDAIVSPWLKGSAFRDTIPLGYWPLPLPDKIESRDSASRHEYLAASAGHFQGVDWLARSAAVIEKRFAGRLTLAETVELSEAAAKLLALNPALRVVAPLEEEQVQLATPESPGRIASADVSRLLYIAPGLVARSPLQQLPPDQGIRYLRGGDAAHVSSPGGADQREMRLWAWLAFLRGAPMVQWPAILPAQNDAQTPADPAEIVWFYPGSWFGIDKPLPTLQLKWLRRAEQDYEYLWLARERGQNTRATLLSRLISRPVDLQAIQSPDQVYSLLSGTSDLKAWDEAMSLLRRVILLSPPGLTIEPAADQALTYEMLGWTQRQARPLLIARSVDWGRGIVDAGGNNWLNLKLGVDIYNAADQQPQRSRLKWASVPAAWSVKEQSSDVPTLAPYTVNRFALEGRVNLSQLTSPSRQPVKIALVDGDSRNTYCTEVVLPVAACEPRAGRRRRSTAPWATGPPTMPCTRAGSCSCTAVAPSSSSGCSICPSLPLSTPTGRAPRCISRSRLTAPTASSPTPRRASSVTTFAAPGARIFAKS